jgi:peroxiredoxin
VEQLRRGDRFPDLTLDSLEGPVRLSERWSERPLVVAFMRHFGCPFCREHLIQLGRHYDEVLAAGGHVVAIFQYRAEPTVSLPLLGPLVRAARVGAFPGKPSGDPSQRPGTFVVDRGGRVVFAHYNVMSPDNPPMSAILEAVGGLAQAA